MSAWVVFRRARFILFSVLVLACLTWTTLFAVFLSRELSHFSHSQKLVVVGLLSLYGVSAILLYLMAVVYFRFWWEVARVFTLLVVHTGGSLLFMHYSPRFPCLGFGTESACRGFVHTILVGCWVVSGIIFCFAIALGIMAFVPRPVETLPGGKEDGMLPSPASFRAGSPTDEERQMSFYSIDSHTGLISYNDQGVLPDGPLYPDRDTTLVNGAPQETMTVGPPRLWDTPRDRAGVVSQAQGVDSFHRNPFRDPTPPPTSIHLQVARTGVGGEYSSISEDGLNLSSAFHGLSHGAPSTAIQRDRATEYTPALSSVLHHYSLPKPVGGNSQPQQTQPDQARTTTPTAHSHHSMAASVHSKWAPPTPHALPPGIAPFRAPSVSQGLKGPSPTYNGTRGSKPSLMRTISQPTGTVQRFGGDAVHRSYTLLGKESPSPRKGSDGQALDQTQWQRLVLNAATKP